MTPRDSLELHVPEAEPPRRSGSRKPVPLFIGRVRLSETHVAWWDWMPLRWRIVWTVSARIPLPWPLIRRAIHASVEAGHRWAAR